MKEVTSKMDIVEEIRKKLGFASKKCYYEIKNGEIIIFSLREGLRTI